MADIQQKNSFDRASLIKILKGFLIAGTGAGALYLLNIIGTIQLNNPLAISLIALLVPTLTNIIKEWMAGEAE